MSSDTNNILEILSKPSLIDVRVSAFLTVAIIVRCTAGRAEVIGAAGIISMISLDCFPGCVAFGGAAV